MTKKSVPKTRWSVNQLEKFIKERSKETVNVVFTDHALQQMKKRHIMMGGVLETLRHGRINMQPEPDMEHDSIKCRMEHFIAGSSVKAVVAISDDDPGLIVVTAF